MVNITTLIPSFDEGSIHIVGTSKTFSSSPTLCESPSVFRVVRPLSEWFAHYSFAPNKSRLYLKNHDMSESVDSSSIMSCFCGPFGVDD